MNSVEESGQKTEAVSLGGKQRADSVSLRPVCVWDAHGDHRAYSQKVEDIHNS